VSRSEYRHELFAQLGADYIDNSYVKEQTIYRATLGLRVNLFDGYATTSKLSHAAIARGVPQSEAQQTALALIYGMVRRQAGILSFNHVFWIIGVSFLLVIPCLLLRRPPAKKAATRPH
jgi:hypothetical protein